MQRITRAIATIATTGVVAGGAAALWHDPAQSAKSAKTAAVASTSGDANAMDSLLAESAQLHAAVDAAKSQLAQLTAGPANGATADQATVLAQLAAARAALAAAERQLAIDEALLARLHAGGARSQTTSNTKSAPDVGSQPNAPTTPGVVNPPPAAAVPTYRAPTPTPNPPPTQTHSPRPTSSPTYGGSDD